MNLTCDKTVDEHYVFIEGAMTIEITLFVPDNLQLRYPLFFFTTQVGYIYNALYI